MNSGLERYYHRQADTYKHISNSSNFSREEHCPQANLRDLTQQQVTNFQKPWIANSLPSINMKAATLAESPDYLERLNKKLLEIDAAGLWNEPLDIDDRISAFIENIKGLLLEKATET